VFPLTLALGASVAWGASDFLGGLVSRRMAVAEVLFWAQLTGLALAVAIWMAAGGDLPSARAAATGAVAGLAELVGFLLLYRGLAVGQMSTIAPLAALTAVLPVAVSVGAGERVAALEAGGMVLAITGSALAAGDPKTKRAVRGAGLALGAALAFGVFLLALGDAGEEAGPAAVLCGRLASVTVLTAFLAGRADKNIRRFCPAARADRPALAILGGLDVLANVAYAEAARGGSGGHGLATVSVLGSLYPLTTVLLARAFLGERLGRIRLTGVTAVLGGVALISLASG
jgi:drug/metabolite transporter (DMT)-like permease